MKASWIACFLLLPLLLSQAQGSSRRKLTSMAAPTSPSSTSKNEKINNGGNVGHFIVDAKGAISGRTGKREEKEESFRIKSGEQKGAYEHYPDVIDIAGMDYSPAKRKPPIHN